MKMPYGISLLVSIFFVMPLFSDGLYPPGYTYIYPLPGAERIDPSSTIILRFGRPAVLSSLVNLSAMIQLRDEQGVRCGGTATIATDHRTVIFTPERNFSSGELITVSISPQFSGANAGGPGSFEYRFSVAKKRGLPGRYSPESEGAPLPRRKAVAPGVPRIMSNGVSVPGDFPHVEVLTRSDPSDDYIFLNNWGPPNYNIIFTPDGVPVWYRRTEDRRRDFKLQPNGWLTMLIRAGYGQTDDAYLAIDDQYEYVREFRTVNGYATDEHDMQVFPDGGYMMIGRRETVVDMSALVAGGRENAVVRETCIQEFTPDDALIFVWRAWDHFNIEDLELEPLTGAYIRFPHMNAIEIDDDGNILLSSRHLSEITKIDRESGEIIWRLCGIPGSPNNDFQFLNDSLNGFRNQHSIRALGGNRYTIFDNGNLHDPPLSRAVEYEIDPVQMTATLVWELRNDRSRYYSYYMGNVQRMKNGNTHINWAVGDVLPIAVEVAPDGEKKLEMRFNSGYHCYRSFRFPWQGQSRRPYLLLEEQPEGPVLIFNKFGAADVAYYRIYADTVSPAVTLYDTSGLTLKQITGLPHGKSYYFRITTVNDAGMESDFSDEVSCVIRDLRPGQELIYNGGFESGMDGWIVGTGGSASASAVAESGFMHIAVANGGANIYDVQLLQNGITLIQGQQYTFTFTAWSDASRIVEIKIGKDNAPWTNYSRIGYSALTRAPKKFTYTFTMYDPTAADARVEINAGGSYNDVYVDTISLIMDPPAGVEAKEEQPATLVLYQNYPNPFNVATTIRYSLPERARTVITIFDIRGRRQRVIQDQTEEAGPHFVRFVGDGCDSGVYLCRVKAIGQGSGRTFLAAKSMVLIK